MPEWHAYVDESGGRLGARAGQGRLVLACIAGSPGSLAELAEKIRRLKLELVPRTDPADWELHAGDMFHGRGGTPLGSIGKTQKMAVMRKIVGIVCGSDVVPFGVVVTSASMHGKKVTDTRITRHATTLLVERLERFAQGLGDGATLRIFSDNVFESNRVAMKGALAKWVSGSHAQSGKIHRVTGTKFVDSRSSALVQVADAIAYVINRYAGGDEEFGDMFWNIGRKAWRRGGWDGMAAPGRRSGSTGAAAPGAALYASACLGAATRTRG